MGPGSTWKGERGEKEQTGIDRQGRRKEVRGDVLASSPVLFASPRGFTFHEG